MRTLRLHRLSLLSKVAESKWQSMDSNEDWFRACALFPRKRISYIFLYADDYLWKLHFGTSISSFICSYLFLSSASSSGVTGGGWMKGVMDTQREVWTWTPTSRLLHVLGLMNSGSGELSSWNTDFGREFWGRLAPALLLDCMLPKSFPGDGCLSHFHSPLGNENEWIFN